MAESAATSAETPPVRRIRFWQHGRAVAQTLGAYAPGVDVLVDQLRATGPLRRFALVNVFMPFYFAREEGWYIPGDPAKRSQMAAIMYLRRDHRQGVRVMHIDDISVDASYRRRGLGERLMRHAETLARRERFPFLKLAVTVTNTPAATLYRRLGYVEQHHRYFTGDPAALASPAAGAAPDAALALRRVDGRLADAAQQRFYRAELDASVPTVAALMAVYYPMRNRGVGAHRYVMEQRGEVVGFADASRQGAAWTLRVSLRPALWASTLERQAIQHLARLVMESAGTSAPAKINVHLASAAHHEALLAGSPSLATELGLTEQHYGGMIMVKVLTYAP